MGRVAKRPVVKRRENVTQRKQLGHSDAEKTEFLLPYELLGFLVQSSPLARCLPTSAQFNRQIVDHASVTRRLAGDTYRV
jgi:hypothetical protein